MYADLSLMRRLVRNVQTVSEDDLRAYAAVADAEIDSQLAAVFEVPIQQVEGKYPDPLPTIAAMLGAALLESQAFSLSSLGATQNPYAQGLAERAQRMLDAVVSGVMLLQGQRRIGTRPVAKAQDRTDVQLKKIRQFRRTGAT